MRPCSLLEMISNEVGLALCSGTACQLRGAILKYWGGGSISGHQGPQMNGLEPSDRRHADSYSNLLILCRGLILRVYTLNHNCYSMDGWRKLSSRCPQAQKQPKSRFCPPKRVTYATDKATFRGILAAFTAQPRQLVNKENQSNSVENRGKQLFLWTLLSLKHTCALSTTSLVAGVSLSRGF